MSMPINFEIVAGEIPQRDEAMNQRRRPGNARCGSHLGKHRFRQMPGWRHDFQLRFARDEIDTCSESMIGALVRDLGREKNGHPERHAQDIQ